MSADWVDQVHDFCWSDDDSPDPADLVELEADLAEQPAPAYPIPPDPWVQ